MADEKAEGDTKICNTCKESMICRLNDYGGKYPAKLQWQDHNTNQAHNNIDGKCKKANIEDEGNDVMQLTPQELKKEFMLQNPGHIDTKDPTPEQFMKLGLAMLGVSVNHSIVDTIRKDTNHKIGVALVERSFIETTMNTLGLQHPGRRGFVEDVLR